MTNRDTKQVVTEDVKRPVDVLVMHAVAAILNHCGNSYSNAYTEKWLTKAKELGLYHGPVIGRIDDIKAEWNDWLDENGGLPDLKA